MRWIIARVKGSKTVSILAGKKLEKSFKRRDLRIGNLVDYVSRFHDSFFDSFFGFFSIEYSKILFYFFWSDRVLIGFIRMEFRLNEFYRKKKSWRQNSGFISGNHGRDLATDNRIIRSSDGGWKESGDLSKKAGIVAINFVSNEDTFLHFVVVREKQPCQNASCSARIHYRTIRYWKKRKNGRFVWGRAPASTETERTEKGGETRRRRSAWP